MKKYISILVAVVAFVLVFGALLTPVQAEEDNSKIEKGIFIGNVDVSGLSEEEAMQKVQTYIDEIGQAEITLNAMNGNSHTICAEDIGLTWINADVVTLISLNNTGNNISFFGKILVV